MSFQTYSKEIVSLAVPFITWGISRLLRAKVKLIWATPFSFTYLLEEPLKNEKGEVIATKQTVDVTSYFFRNDGSETAKQVEITFNWKPLCINLAPVRNHTVNTLPDGRHVLTFSSLAPKESLRIELLSINKNLPQLVSARCEQGAGRMVEMIPFPTVRPWVIMLYRILAFVGACTAIYLIILALQFLILGTPFGVPSPAPTVAP